MKVSYLQKKRNSGLKKSLIRQWQLWVMTLFPMLFVFVFHYIPMAGIIVAFKNYKYNTGIWFSEWTGFENFKFLFQSDTLGRIVYNTLAFNIASIAISMAASILVAVLLYMITNRWCIKVYQTLLILPNYLSWVIIAFIVYGFLSPNGGMLNEILEKIGISAVDWYQNPAPWPVILMVCRLWQGTGMGSVLYYATLLNADPCLFEAATIDGASKIQIFWKIVIPILYPLIAFNLILSVGGIFGGDFGLFYQVTKNSAALYPTTDIIPTFIYRLLRNADIGMSSAAGLVQSVVGCILVVGTNLIVRKIDPDKSLF